MKTAIPGTDGGATVRSVERALDILGVLERAGQPMGLAEVARATNLPKATTQRLLSVLERRDFVQRERGFYRLGPGTITLAGAFLTGSSLLRAALPILEQMALHSGETVSLQVRRGFDRVVVQRVQSHHSLGYNLQIGQRLPLHLGAAGKLLCAAMPPEEMDQFLSQIRDVRRTGGEVLSIEQFLTELDGIRNQGHAVSRGEREAGVVSVAAAVSKPGGGVLAVTAITGPAHRMSEQKIEQLSWEVRQAAQAIGAAYARV